MSGLRTQTSGRTLYRKLVGKVNNANSLLARDLGKKYLLTEDKKAAREALRILICLESPIIPTEPISYRIWVPPATERPFITDIIKIPLPIIRSPSTKAISRRFWEKPSALRTGTGSSIWKQRQTGKSPVPCRTALPWFVRRYGPYQAGGMPCGCGNQNRQEDGKDQIWVLRKRKGRNEDGSKRKV